MKDLIPTQKEPIELLTRKTLYYTRFLGGLTCTSGIHCVVPGGSGSHRIDVGGPAR